MFRKTRLRLTIINSIVFIIILSILATIIFTYIRSTLYRDSDHDLQSSLNMVEKTGHLEGKGKIGPGRPTTTIVWDKNKKIIQLQPEYADESVFKKAYSTHYNEIENVTLDGVHLRSLSVQAVMNGQKVTIQFLQNVEAQVSVLNKLVMILIIGSVTGVLLSIVAGFYLAKRALQPVQKAWDKQNQFVSDASHELRTPLTIIQTRGELLFDSPNSTIQESAKHVSVILKESRRLRKLVSHLLTLARADTNKIELDVAPFRLNELLDEVVEPYRDIAMFENKQINFTSTEPITFLGARDRIHQLVVILLDNALKYTNEGGKIDLACYETKTHIGIVVEDNGIGIKPENLEKIFHRFYQVDQSRSKNDSLGLGLSIAQWIIEKHHGKIKVKSDWGKGTRFDIQFSKRKKAVAAIEMKQK